MSIIVYLWILALQHGTIDRFSLEHQFNKNMPPRTCWDFKINSRYTSNVIQDLKNERHGLPTKLNYDDWTLNDISLDHDYLYIALCQPNQVLSK